jgi:hypothetical protein
MNKICRNLASLIGGCLAVQAAAQEPSFLQWNIQMNTPRLQSASVVQLKNLNKAQLVGFKPYAKIDVTSPGINLEWQKKVFTGYTDIRFEIQAPGQVGPALGPISFANDVAIRVGFGDQGGYLVKRDTRFGIDMDISRMPSYEWRVINFARAADGITGRQKVALLNTKKKAFLVYQSRRIGFEVGWWEYVPPRKPASVLSRPIPVKKSNDGEIRPFLIALRAINEPQSRFVRRFLGVGYQ